MVVAEQNGLSVKNRSHVMVCFLPVLNNLPYILTILFIVHVFYHTAKNGT